MIPDLPPAIDGARTEATVKLRYEDVSQEGQLLVLGIPHAVDEVCWFDVLQSADAKRVLATGVVPIRSRLVIEGGDGPISALQPMQGRGAWHRAAVRGPDGAVKRLLLLMWVDLYAPQGWTLLPPDPSAPVVRGGRVYLEHVFTRPFAPAAERRVLDLEGRVPAGDWPERRFEDVAPDPPAGAATTAQREGFGVMHTDPNGHVNSLVYLRRFEAGAMALRGAPDAARSAEIMWRKPFFSGEAATLEQWVAGDAVHGRFVDDDGAVRARVTMGF